MKKSKEELQLAFRKTSIIELNDEQIHKINGGSSNLLSVIIEATTYGTWLMTF